MVDFDQDLSPPRECLALVMPQETDPGNQTELFDDMMNIVCEMKTD